MDIKPITFMLMLIGISLFTYLPRALPIIYLSKKKLPIWLTEWMKFIPAGIFAALIFPDIFTMNNSLSLNFTNIKLMAAIIVFIVSIKKKSLGISIFTGVSCIYILSII